LFPAIFCVVHTIILIGGWTQANLLLIKLQFVLEEGEPEQKIATSSTWLQLLSLIPFLEQERRHDSFPEQPTSSSQIIPEPAPNLQMK